MSKKVRAKVRTLVIDRTWYRRPKGMKIRRAAGGVVLRRFRGRWFLALAREGDYHDWVLPKGGVDKGESLVEAAQREVEEEAGLTRLRLLGKLGVRSRFSSTKHRWNQVHYFVFVTHAPIQAPSDRKKHPHRARWFPLNRLPRMFWPEQCELLRTRVALLRRLLKQAPASAR